MIELMKDFKSVGLFFSTGIVGIALLALITQITFMTMAATRKLRARRKQAANVIILHGPQATRYLPRG